MRKQSPVRLLFITLLLFLSFPQTFVIGNAQAANTPYGAIEIENRNDTGAACSCDVKLSGGQIKGSVFAVLFSESEQVKFIAEYPAEETVRVSLADVSKTDYIRILWTDEKHMPLAKPYVLRMEENNAAAYENFTKQLADSLKEYNGMFGSSDEEKPYALARLLVSCDTLPDLSKYRGKVTPVSGPDNLHVLQFYDPAEAEKCEKELKADPSVRYVEQDAVMRMRTNGAESGSNSSHHLWGVSKTGIDEYAENLRQNGNAHSVIVAVVDSGVEIDHPLLANRLIAGYDFVQYDEIPLDEHKHGTHVAGTIAYCTPGMDVKIMPVRVLNAFASGSFLSIANGIRYAADHGANIINLSLGSANHSKTIEDAVSYALSKNITVVVAAGNYGGNVQYFCPAHMEDCITVAAVDINLKRYRDSNYGDAVDIAAPGVEIESSVLKGKYEKMSGTSMAAPHVSAAAALLMCERGTEQTPFQISSLLRDAADDLGEPGNDVYFGAGFLNMRPLIQRNAYALLYADGELVFQKSNAPAPNRALIESYPIAISGDGGAQSAAWYNRRSDIRKVTFAESIRPVSTALWFSGCENLSEVRGIENLDASELTDISQMFRRCVSLKTLDLSGLDTGNVRNMDSAFRFCEGLTELDLTGWNTKNAVNAREMFAGCAALKTVYASDSFSTEKMTDSEEMFQGCTSLVGGADTTYNGLHTGKEYARIDNPPDAPGYFTDKNSVRTHTVKFDANGGAGFMDDQTFTTVAALRENRFTRTGYNFAGWNTKADGSGIAYSDKANYVGSDITLFAQWILPGVETVTLGFGEIQWSDGKCTVPITAAGESDSFGARNMELLVKFDPAVLELESATGRIPPVEADGNSYSMRPSRLTSRVADQYGGITLLEMINQSGCVYLLIVDTSTEHSENHIIQKGAAIVDLVFKLKDGQEGKTSALSFEKADAPYYASKEIVIGTAQEEEYRINATATTSVTIPIGGAPA